MYYVYIAVGLFIAAFGFFSGLMVRNVTMLDDITRSMNFLMGSIGIIILVFVLSLGSVEAKLRKLTRQIAALREDKGTIE